MTGIELHVRPEGERLVLEVSDRQRRAGGVPGETTSLRQEDLSPRLEQMSRLVAEVCRRGEAGPSDYEAWAAHGQILFDLLVPAGLRGLLREAEGGSLWLRLRGWAADLPWEWLDGGRGPWCERYALGREVPIPSRPSFVPGVPLACPARTVVLGDCAGDLPQARDEVEAVHRALRAVGLRPRTQAGELLADDLRVSFRAADILHVAAHVDPPSGDSDRGPGIRCVDAHLASSELAAMGGDRPFPALVVLNACHSSSLAPVLLASGTGHVVATAADVGDVAAARVAVELFAQIARGLSLGEALRLARGAAGDALLAASYLLYGDPDSDLAACFPSSGARSEQADAGAGPAAWIAACFHLESGGEDSREGEQRLRSLLARLEQLLADTGLRPVRIGTDGVVARLALDEFGDSYGDAAAEVARRVVGARFGGDETDWTGTRRVRLGLGLCAGDKGRNRALWLAGSATGGAVLADDRIRDLCREPAVRWSRHPLGSDGDRRTWRLDFLDPAPQPPAAMVGRADCVEQLQSTLHEAIRGGNPQIAVVTGPAGIGKSALLDAFAATLPPDVVVVRGAAGLLGGFDVRGPGLPDGTGCGPPWPRDGLVAGLVRASCDPGVAEVGAEPWRWAEVLAVDERPLVWLVDRVERPPASFVADLDGLLDELDGRALCAVLSMRAERPEDKVRAERLSIRAGGGTLRLGPLRPQDCRQILRQRLAVDHVPPELEPLVERSAGNPLLLLAAVGQCRQEGVLVRPGRSLRIEPGRAEEVGPAPIEEALVGARLSELPKAARAVVEAIAVFGGEAPVLAIESLPTVERAGAAAAASLGWTRTRSAASPRGREAWICLREPLVARVLPYLIPPRRERALHDAAFAWLEGRGAPPGERAKHGLRSNQPVQAIPALWEEALGCQAGGDFEGVLAALDPLERLVATTPEPDLPPGTPHAGTIRALHCAAQRVREAEHDPTIVETLTEFSSSSFEPVRGRRIDRYDVIQTLAVGGTGTVYLAQQEGPGGFARRVALKVLHNRLAANPAFLRSFLAEARIAACLSSANIVGVTDLGQSGDLWYLAMDFVPGCSLRELLSSCDSGLPADVALAVAAGVARGLARAHESEWGPVIHRDVCPESILLGADGVPRLLDFGMAGAADRVGPATETGALRGRVEYVAPERAEGAVLGPAADLWSLGTVLFEMLTGQRLFAGRSILAVLDSVCGGAPEPALSRVETIDAELGSWLRRILVRDPADRIASGTSMAGAFDRIALRLSPPSESPTARLAGLVRDVLAARPPDRLRIGPDGR